MIDIKLLVLHGNTRKFLCANKTVSVNNTLNHLTVCKQMINVK